MNKKFARPEDVRPDVAEVGRDLLHAGPPAGPPSVFTCPVCGGPLWERQEAELLRFRCHLGHAYTGEALMDGQATAVEQAMWTAARVGRGGRAAAAHGATRDHEMAAIAADCEEQKDDFERRATEIRRVLVATDATPSADAEVVAERARRAQEQ